MLRKLLIAFELRFMVLEGVLREVVISLTIVEEMIQRSELYFRVDAT